MKTRVNQVILTLLAASAFAHPASAEVMRSNFTYRLSDSNGALPISWATMNWDSRAGELYVIDSSSGTVDVFNDNGMEVFAFGNDSGLGTVVGAVPIEGGDIVVLAVKTKEWSLVRCNFRGEPIARIAVSGVPGGFSPSALRTAKGKLYLADGNNLMIVEIGISGAVSASWDLAKLLKLDLKKRPGNDLRGFNVSPDGNILGTISGLFLAFVLTPDGQLHPFGTRGGAPGKFNIVAGIAADETGHLYVTDVLRAVVIVFDKEFKFIGEFGYRGYDDDNLVAPNEVAVSNGRVFVSQSVGGVKVFEVVFQ